MFSGFISSLLSSAYVLLLYLSQGFSLFPISPVIRYSRHFLHRKLKTIFRVRLLPQPMEYFDVCCPPHFNTRLPLLHPSCPFLLLRQVVVRMRYPTKSGRRGTAYQSSHHGHPPMTPRTWRHRPPYGSSIRHLSNPRKLPLFLKISIFLLSEKNLTHPTILIKKGFQ